MQQPSVIIADDHRATRQWVAEMLAAEYDVITQVENGQLLVDAVRAYHPDLAVTDISMPVLTGLEAADELQRLGTRTKVIFFTANASQAYLRRAFQVGAMGYVLKNAGAEDLPSALKAVLGGVPFVSPGIGPSGLPPW